MLWKVGVRSLQKTAEEQPLAVAIKDEVKPWDAEDGEDNISGLDDEGIDYQNKFAIAVECEDEAHQEEIYDKLTEMGYKCKVLTL